MNKFVEVICKTCCGLCTDNKHTLFCEMRAEDKPVFFSDFVLKNIAVAKHTLSKEMFFTFPLFYQLYCGNNCPYKLTCGEEIKNVIECFSYFINQDNKKISSTESLLLTSLLPKMKNDTLVSYNFELKYNQLNRKAQKKINNMSKMAKRFLISWKNKRIS